MGSADPRARGSGRSLLARAVFDAHGNIRTGPLIGIVFTALVVLTIGTYVALLAAGLGSANVLGFWVAIAFIGIKVPILLLIWYLLGRSGESQSKPKWTDEESAEILEYLRREATVAAGRPDAASRLQYYANEAWFVAERGSGEHTADAVDLAVRIEGMARRARDRTGTKAGEHSAPNKDA
jgi:hypothetical protein